MRRYIKGIDEERAAAPLSDLLVRIDLRAAPPHLVWPKTIFCAACRVVWLQALGKECVERRKRFPEYFALKDLDGWDS